MQRAHPAMVFCFPWIMAGLAAAAQPGLTTRVNRNELYLGESVILTVEVAGVSNPPTPDLSGIRDARIEFLGSRSRNQFSVSMVNGRFQQTGFYGRDFTYRVTPTLAGPLRVGPVQVRIQSRNLRAEGPDILVRGIEEQDDVLIEITASQESVLVDEPFEVTLTVAVRRLEGDYARLDPLHPDKPPHLEIPYLAGDVPAGLKGPDVQARLQQMLVTKQRQPAFRINNYTVRKDPFDKPFSFEFGRMEEDALFRLDRRPVEKNGRQYFAYATVLRYLPEEQGAYTFGPAVFKGSIITRVGQDGNTQLRDVFAVGAACTVRVVPPPEEGRPATYVGAIGSNVVAEAFLDTQTCRVGDPLQLTVRVSGDMRIENLSPPNLADQAELTRRFKIYEDTIQVARAPEQVDFSCTARPIEPGTYEVPPIEIAYFDTHRREYSIARTRPIPIRVNAATEMQPPIVIGAPEGSDPAAEGGRDVLVVAPLDVDSSGLFPAAAAPMRWRWGAPGPLAWLLVMLGKAGRHVASRRSSGRQRRHALPRALRRLSRLGSRAGDASAADHSELCRALREYLSDRYAVAGSAMTPPEVLDLLRHNGVDDESAAALHDILERHFNAGYGEEQAPGPDLPADCRRAALILKEMDR